MAAPWRVLSPAYWYKRQRVVFGPVAGTPETIAFDAAALEISAPSFVIPAGAGALPAWSSVAAIANSATLPGTVDVALPTHSSGDLLVLQQLVKNDNNDASLDSINTSGWAQLGGAGNEYGGAQAVKLGIGWKIGNGSETVVNVTTNGGTTNDRRLARVHRFTAANGFAATPIANITSSTGTSASVSMPTVNPGGALNRLAVALIATAGTTTVAASTGESGGDWTEPTPESAQTNGTSAIQISSQSGGGSISGGTAALGSSANWVVVGFTLEPADLAGDETITFDATALQISTPDFVVPETVPFDATTLEISSPSFAVPEAILFDPAALEISAPDFTVLAAETMTFDPAGLEISGPDFTVLAAETIAFDSTALEISFPDFSADAAEIIPFDAAALAISAPDFNVSAATTITFDAAALQLSTPDFTVEEAGDATIIFDPAEIEIFGPAFTVDDGDVDAFFRVQQGKRQRSFRLISGTTGTYAEDALAAFQAEATIPAGATYNEALMIWLQLRLSTAHDHLPDLMQEFAESEGAVNWNCLGSFGPLIP